MDPRRRTILLLICALAGCGARAAPDAAPPAATGRLSLAWTIADLTGRALDCAQARATSVLLQARRADGTGVTATFPCGDGLGAKELPPGTYAAALELDSTAGTLALVPAQDGLVVIDGQDTALIPVQFPVDPVGGLLLELAPAPGTASSLCGFPPVGAGITGTTVVVTRALGGCAPVVFERSGGPITTPYAVDCSSPEVAACVETTEVLSVPGMASGAYTIGVRGKIGALDCWVADGDVLVPQPGTTIGARLILSRAPGC